MNCAMARKRIMIGVPITTEHGSGADFGQEARSIAETVCMPAALLLLYLCARSIAETVYVPSAYVPSACVPSAFAPAALLLYRVHVWLMCTAM